MSESVPRVPPADTASVRDPLELPATRLLQDWKSAAQRARQYLAAAGVREPDASAIAERAAEIAATASASPSCDALAETLAAMRQLLLDKLPRGNGTLSSEDEFLAWRLMAAFAGGASDVPLPVLASPLPLRRRLASMPPFARASMSPNRFRWRGLRRSIEPAEAPEQHVIGPHAPRIPGQEPQTGRKRLRPWTWAARRRRTLLAILVWIPSLVAGGFMVNVLPQQGSNPLEVAIAICFAALFGWISIGCWTALFGFVLLLFRRDKFAITRSDAERRQPLGGEVTTAIVMPICEEPVDRVFAGLRAIHASLERAGQVAPFHFFVLSDTRDPSKTMEEEAAWFAWCRETRGFGRIFYRRRKVRIERKSGNVADFCRRFGKAYRYMIMLDADSVMSGATLVRLSELMEANPGVGMIQTAPVAVNQSSLFARVQQFTSRLYGRIFAAGLHYWQLGEGQYWGHNTIIRVAPFMEHCALPRLPGEPPLGGEILSHDFVEAALMGRAGWALWLAYDLPGSFEEVPSSLLEEMKRDRRWCQGNIQHLRLLPTEGLYGAHRALFLNGVLSYVSAMLWFAFLILSSAAALYESLREPVYFPEGRSLFPEWPVWRPDWALALAGVTAAILFLPKILAIVLAIGRGEARQYGGVAKLLQSVLFETAISSLFAPIRMVFHTRFVLTNLTGYTVTWSSQRRGESETGWREAIRHHGVDTVVASLWAFAVGWLNPMYFWWLTPVVLALVLSIPLSVWTSRVRPGERARQLGLLVTPEETIPPPELVDVQRGVEAADLSAALLPEWRRDGFSRAVVDPLLNAVHCALIGSGRSLAEKLRHTNAALVDRAVSVGPQALGAVERRRLLRDAEALLALHRSVWQIGDQERAARWGLG